MNLIDTYSRPSLDVKQIIQKSYILLQDVANLKMKSFQDTQAKCTGRGEFSHN